ncbi:UNVERIFIED_CONTAM: putative AC transposase, partial [Sesamum latifolium]
MSRFQSESNQSTSIHSSGGSGDNEDVTHKSRGDKRKKSVVWEHFTKVRGVNDVMHAKYNYCEKLLSGNVAYALPLKEAFSRLQRIDKLYKFNPPESEWEVAKIVHECLQIFYEATRHFSGQTFSILDWWKTNSPKLPILAKIARGILALPATTVASEAAFSVGGRVVQSRACLLSDVVEALVVADDWIGSIPKKTSNYHTTSTLSSSSSRSNTPTPSSNSSNHRRHKWVGPSGHRLIRVDVHGLGDFRSVQAAVDSVPEGNRKNVLIQISAGCY